MICKDYRLHIALSYIFGFVTPFVTFYLLKFLSKIGVLKDEHASAGEKDDNA